MLPPGDPRAPLLEEIKAAAEGKPTELYVAAGFLPGGPRKLWVAVSAKDGWSRRYETGEDVGPGIWAGKMTLADIAPVARALLDAGFPNIWLPGGGAPFPSVVLYAKGATPNVSVEIQLPIAVLRDAPGLLASLDAVFAAARKSCGESKWLLQMIELARSPAGVPPKPVPERVMDAVCAIAEGADINEFKVVLDLPSMGPVFSTEIVQLGAVLEGQNGQPRTKIGVSKRADLKTIATHLRDADLLRINIPPAAPALTLTISCDKDLRYERALPVAALDALPELRAAVFAIGGVSEKLLAEARK
jgi:hypothetical protein